MVDTFVKQLDGCDFPVNGIVPSGGFNCTCAVEAMWLFRASRGTVHETSCDVRRLTGDHVDGTNLTQMEAVSHHFGITGGVVYKPATSALFTQLIATGRYGAHLQGSYSALRGTRYDCFFGNFRGNHDWYVSGPGSRAGTWRVGDPGADGRHHGLVAAPDGYQDIPISTMLIAASRLDVGGHQLGAGKVYAYLTPPDAFPATSHSKAAVTVATSLWNDTTKRWVFNGPNRLAVGTKLEIRGRQFPKGGVACYPVTDGTYALANHTSKYAGYYVPVSHVKVLGRI